MTTNRTNFSHKDCTHPNTKTARAACRRRHVAVDTEKVVTQTFVFVRRARGEGYANQVKEVTFYEVAAQQGIKTFDAALAKKLAREQAQEKDEWELLAEDVRPVKEVE